MSMTQEMIKQIIYNWLDALVTGANAMNVEVLCADVPEEVQYAYTTSVWDKPVVDGLITVHIHRIQAVAMAAELDLQHRDFVEGDYYYGPFSGEDFFIYGNVRFSDMILREEKEKLYGKEKNEGEQNSDSGVSEGESVDNE